MVRWGILGTANIAIKVKSAIDQSGTGRVVAVASRSLEKAETFKAVLSLETDEIAAYGSYDELLSDPNVDAVYIPLPSGIKKAVAIAAATKGKHVLAEKPFVSTQEVNEILETCRKHGVCFMDGTMFVHNPRTHEVAQLLREGELGPLGALHTDFHFHLPKETPEEENIRLNRALEPHGAAGDLGWYNIRMSLVATGYAMPKRVFATAVNHRGVLYGLSGILWFEGDLRATLSCGFLSNVSQLATISGTSKMLTVDGYVIPWSMEQNTFPKVTPTNMLEFTLRDGEGVTEVRKIDLGTKSQEARMIETMHRLIVKKREEPSNSEDHRWGEETLMTQRILDALIESAEKGIPVEVK